MLKHNSGDLYLRRMKLTDKADSMMTSVALAARGTICQNTGRKPPIVAVRRGFPGEVMAVGYTKRELKARFIGGGRCWKETARFFRVARPAKKEDVSE